jgi:hypothetical protein
MKKENVAEIVYLCHRSTAHRVVCAVPVVTAQALA